MAGFIGSLRLNEYCLAPAYSETKKKHTTNDYSRYLGDEVTFRISLSTSIFIDLNVLNDTFMYRLIDIDDDDGDFFWE